MLPTSSDARSASPRGARRNSPAQENVVASVTATTAELEPGERRRAVFSSGDATATQAGRGQNNDDGAADDMSNDNSISTANANSGPAHDDAPRRGDDGSADNDGSSSSENKSAPNGSGRLAHHFRAYSDISPIGQISPSDNIQLDRRNRECSPVAASSGILSLDSEKRATHRRQNSDSAKLLMSTPLEEVGFDSEVTTPRKTVVIASSFALKQAGGDDAVVDMQISSTQHHPTGMQQALKNGNGASNGFDVLKGSNAHKTFRPKSIQFQTLRYDVPVNRRKDKKSILKSVSGEFKAGQLHAILGPSGAGKSTLMNVLAGYKIRHMTGTVLVNGKPRDSRAFRKMSCYIMQDDHLLPQLTVMESMMCSANLKLEEATTLKVKREAIVEILETLGLHEQVHNRVGNLSGGQRKRLSIALELINNPPIMFLDEPTSGLDSVSCYQCVQLLKRLALGGRNIICTIHQPSAKVFEIFDTVFVMCEGEAMYDGPFSCIVPYFALHNLNCPPYHNPSDFLMEVATGDYGDVAPHLTHWIRTGQAHTEIQRLMKISSKRSIATQTAAGLSASGTSGAFHSAPVGTTPSDTAETEQQGSSGSRAPSLMDSDNASLLGQGEQVSLTNGDGKGRGKCSDLLGRGGEQPRNFATSIFTQFRILFIRTFLTILRDSTLTQVRLLTHAFIAVLIGLMYLRIGNDASKVVNNAASLFFTCLFLNFGALMPTILTFPNEVFVFLREHLNYWYSLKAYYLAKTAADMPFQVGLPIVYTVIVYFMTGQPNDFLRFFLFTTIMVLTSFVAQSLGLLISAMARAEIAVFLGPITVIPLLLFSGFLASFDTMPKYLTYLSYFSYLRYSFEGSMMAIYGFNRTGLTCDGIFASPDSPDGPPSGKYSPERVQSCVLFSTGDAVMKSFGLTDVNLTLDIVMLIVFFIIFRIACYCALRWRVYMSK